MSVIVRYLISGAKAARWDGVPGQRSGCAQRRSDEGKEWYRTANNAVTWLGQRYFLSALKRALRMQARRTQFKADCGRLALRAQRPVFP
jgi:hypothetical protein